MFPPETTFLVVKNTSIFLKLTAMGIVTCLLPPDEGDRAELLKVFTYLRILLYHLSFQTYRSTGAKSYVPKFFEKTDEISVGSNPGYYRKAHNSLDINNGRGCLPNNRLHIFGLTIKDCFATAFVLYF